MSVRMTLAPSRTKRWAAAPPKPMSSPLMAAAAPVSRAILEFRRILFSCFAVDRGKDAAFCVLVPSPQRGPAWISGRARSLSLHGDETSGVGGERLGHCYTRSLRRNQSLGELPMEATANAPP